MADESKRAEDITQDSTDHLADESQLDESIEDVTDSVEQSEQPAQSVVEKDYEDLYLRTQAEMQNMQQRFAKTQQQWQQYDGQKLATSLLPVVDNLERALAVEIEAKDADKLKSGVEMVYKSLVNALAENNIVAFGETGEVFNPEKHQAVQQVPVEGDAKSETIAQVMQKGYLISDRVIRPAVVSVYQ